MVIRLAVVVNRFPVLSESFILNKVRGLRAAGIDVTVFVQRYSTDNRTLPPTIDSNMMDIVQGSLTSGGIFQLARHFSLIVSHHPREALQLLKRAHSLYGSGSRAIKAWILALPIAIQQFDVIHFEFSGVAVTYKDALPLLRPAKMLISCRGAAEQIAPLMKPERVIELREVLNFVDRVHCVSADMQRIVEGYGLAPGKSFINHPSIDPLTFRRDLNNPYYTRSTGPYRLVSTGRLHWKKGFEYALLAVRKLIDDGYNVHYDIIGSGPEEESLRFTIHDLNLSDYVEIKGWQSPLDVRRALQLADIYLLPSISEGLSNAALEAMAMELPIISTSAGGMKEAIIDGKEGFLVSSRKPMDMANMIIKLIDDRDLRYNMGQSGRKRIESHFNLTRQIECFVSAYNSLTK